eukprot:CAMPEP_0178816612 /NCGR_PEP_ID=MMETSP0746-20121128/1441_1 /TAXON_ID=913974 /ORGANISM="Nitzschia punctata, Strain CCMP561" /LENGTH=153 /DNA_ID=CAMNT_0020477641 /DNA_START=50 /DNA_END=511 /DNA_ORIENTATION=-
MAPSNNNEAMASYINDLILAASARGRTTRLVSDNARATTRAYLSEALDISEASYRALAPVGSRRRSTESRWENGSNSRDATAAPRSSAATPLTVPTRRYDDEDNAGYTFCPNERKVSSKDLPTHLRALPYTPNTVALASSRRRRQRSPLPAAA